MKYIKKYNFFTLLMLVFAVTGCSSTTPSIDTSPNAEITYDGRHEVKGVYVRLNLEQV